MIIRNAAQTDRAALADILNHYVVNGHVTFDTAPATARDRARWFASYGAERHQLLVAEERGRILGCAYSSRFRSHPAFDTTVETSIYLDPAARGRGIGTRLYEHLSARLPTHGVHVAVAGVAVKHGAFISSLWFERVLDRD